jgi:type II restriction enzyme
MARKHELRRQHAGMILNFTSKQQEAKVAKALKDALVRLQDAFDLQFDHKREWKLQEIVARLREEYPDVPFAEPFARSSMKPDGGVLSIVDQDGKHHPILIVEVKNQGTNVERIAEGLPRQAKGNAIERLGKNVIGFRTAMLPEGIMPFVCFGYGCDFEKGSSILDRVVTIAMFGPLREINVVPLGESGQFCRGSYYFREREWTRKEMATVMFEIASRSIYFYFAKYGEASFGAG